MGPAQRPDLAAAGGTAAGGQLRAGVLPPPLSCKPGEQWPPTPTAKHSSGFSVRRGGVGSGRISRGRKGGGRGVCLAGAGGPPLGPNPPRRCLRLARSALAYFCASLAQRLGDPDTGPRLPAPVRSAPPPPPGAGIPPRTCRVLPPPTASSRKTTRFFLSLLRATSSLVPPRTASAPRFSQGAID